MSFIIDVANPHSQDNEVVNLSLTTCLIMEKVRSLSLTFLTSKFKFVRINQYVYKEFSRMTGIQ